MKCFLYAIFAVSLMLCHSNCADTSAVLCCVFVFDAVSLSDALSNMFVHDNFSFVFVLCLMLLTFCQCLCYDVFVCLC
jgi:hypothetical protein